MKKILFLLAVVVLSAIVIVSCKKNKTEDPNLTYIKDFYGVNMVHSFVCLNPTNDQKSLKVDLVWDEKGVATYTTTDIPKDSANEHNARLFMPASEFDGESGTIAPTKPVKTVMLTLSNGALEPVENLNGCHPYYTCSCGGGNADALYVNGVFQWWYCYQSSSCSPSSLVYHGCNGTITDYAPLIGWQSM